MINVVRLKTKLAARRTKSASNYIAPTDLHTMLEVSSTQVVTFKAEKDMQRYRSMLYSINKQGEFRYRTLRDENSMWGLVIWRMH